MKKTLFAVLTLLAVLPAAQAACTFSSQANGEVNAIIKAHGNWPVSDAQCAALNAKKLILVVNGQATVLDGVSVAWANVTVLDTALHIKADSVQWVTRVNAKQASMDVAEKMQYDSIADAVDGYDFTEAAKQIDVYRAKAAASVKQPAKR